MDNPSQLMIHLEKKVQKLMLSSEFIQHSGYLGKRPQKLCVAADQFFGALNVCLSHRR